MSKAKEGERHLGVDLHKHYVVIGGVNTRQEEVLQPRRVELDKWVKWAKAHLHPTDILVVEATTNTWEFYDETVGLVQRVIVADPRKIAWIAHARVSTDPQAAMKLARLSAAGLVPEVWVPPVEVRELRTLIAHRRQLVKQQTMLKNQLHSLLHRHHLALPEGDPFAACNREWWEGLQVSPTERLHIRQDLATLAQVMSQLAEVDVELHRLSRSEPWAATMAFLIQLPGIGIVIAMMVLSAVGDITRFPSSKKLVGYSGLGAGVHDSGQTHRSGHITKEGRKELRWAMVEAAWSAVKTHPHWKAEYERLCQRMHPNKAIVVIARKLLVIIWHVWTKQATDRHADADKVAFKLILWAQKLSNEQRGGMTTRQFVRYQLMQLKLGDNLTHVVRGGARRLIAPPEEIRNLYPELVPDG